MHTQADRGRDIRTVCDKLLARRQLYRVDDKVRDGVDVLFIEVCVEIDVAIVARVAARGGGRGRWQKRARAASRGGEAEGAELRRKGASRAHAHT